MYFALLLLTCLSICFFRKNNHGVCERKRMDDPIRNFPQEAATNNFPIKPLKKRLLQELSSSSSASLVQFYNRSQPTSSKGVGVDEMWTSFFTEINGSGDDALIWDVGFPLGDLVDKHFGKEMHHEKAKELGLQRALQTNLADCIHTTLLLRIIGRMFGDFEKEYKALVGEIAELKKLIIRLKDQRNKLKKTLKVSSFEKNQLKAEIEELKDQISLQYKAGYNKALKQLLASELKP